jgi:hypothetical protein
LHDFERDTAVLVLGGLVTAAMAGLFGALLKVSSRNRATNRQIRQTAIELQEYVLPHFRPRSEEEIRAGAPDHTIPARQTEMLHTIAVVQRTQDETAQRLAKHLVDEAAAAASSAERERLRDQKIDKLLLAE